MMVFLFVFVEICGIRLFVINKGAEPLFYTCGISSVDVIKTSIRFTFWVCS